MKILNKTNGVILAQKADIADSVFARAKGLLRRKDLLSGEGLVLKPCNSIHTFFMRFPIDVLFVSKEGQVIETIASLKPFRITAVYFRSAFVIELPSGTINSTSTQKEDLISLED
jgi:uncharacterized membrane protein (UPF0127 family)